MTIYDAMKKEGIRITFGDNWMIYTESNLGIWTVYQRKYRAHKTRVLYEGSDESKAVEFLLHF